MQHATKMVMVPQDIYSGLLAKENQTYSPLVGQLANLDHELNSIMTNPNLSSDMKYQLYQQTFNRYQHLKNQQFPRSNQFPTTVVDTSTSALPKTSAAAVIGTQTNLEIDESSLISGLPKTVRRKGKILLDHIRKQQPEFNFTPSGELIDGTSGKSIPGSNITDLVHFTTRNRPSAQPPSGAGEFMKLLLKTNVPKEAINTDLTNKNTQGGGDESFLSEEDFRTPTASSSTILGTIYSPPTTRIKKTPKSSQSGKKVGVKTRRYNQLSPVRTPRKPRTRNPPLRYGQFVEQR
jgi:hypothetical protein